MIFYRKDERGFETKINWAVFPALQGGPHEHQIAGVATQLLEVQTPEYKAYAGRVVENCRALAAALVAKGYTLATGGTYNHLILWDLRSNGLTGSKLELVCDKAHITLNKNSVCGDKSALSPGGVRVGTPALTTRGFGTDDFVKVADFLDRAVKIALDVQAEHGKALKTFRPALEGNAALEALRADVNAFAKTFPMPGI